MGFLLEAAFSTLKTMVKGYGIARYLTYCLNINMVERSDPQKG
jgi:hypothetical protein